MQHQAGAGRSNVAKCTLLTRPTPPATAAIPSRGVAPRLASRLKSSTPMLGGLAAANHRLPTLGGLAAGNHRLPTVLWHFRSGSDMG
jgi:hypothetical protein